MPVACACGLRFDRVRLFFLVPLALVGSLPNLERIIGIMESCASTQLAFSTPGQPAYALTDGAIVTFHDDSGAMLEAEACCRSPGGSPLRLVPSPRHGPVELEAHFGAEGSRLTQIPPLALFVVHVTKDGAFGFRSIGCGDDGRCRGLRLRRPNRRPAEFSPLVVRMPSFFPSPLASRAGGFMLQMPPQERGSPSPPVPQLGEVANKGRDLVFQNAAAAKTISPSRH